MRFLILLFVITILTESLCAQRIDSTNHIVDQRAIQLNDSAVKAAVQYQSYETAIALLDKALQIDSNYLMALANKCSYELALHQYDQAINATKKMIKLKPQAPEYFVSGGLAYFLSGDSTSSQKYFKEAVAIYDRILDTMNKKNNAYKLVLMGKAVNLIFSGDSPKGNVILKYLDDNTHDEIEKEFYTEFINKPSKEIIDEMVNGKQDTSTSTASIESPLLDYDTIQYYTNREITRRPIKDGFYLLKEDFTKLDGVKLQDSDRYYYIAKYVMMSFENLDTVFKKYDQHFKRYIIEFNFNKIGTKYLKGITEECTNRPLGIIINDKLIAAPNILDQIYGGKMDLTGLFSEEEVDKIVKGIELRHNNANLRKLKL